jgi:hypothetical protein
MNFGDKMDMVTDTLCFNAKKDLWIDSEELTKVFNDDEAYNILTIGMVISKEYDKNIFMFLLGVPEIGIEHKIAILFKVIREGIEKYDQIKEVFENVKHRPELVEQTKFGFEDLENEPIGNLFLQYSVVSAFADLFYKFKNREINLSELIKQIKERL